MKVHQSILIVLLILVICGVVYGDDCSMSDSTLRKMDPAAAVEFIKGRFAAADYSCAIHATQIQTKSLVKIPGLAGIDARYAWRDMSFDLAQTCSSEIGLKLLQDASSSLVGGATTWSKAERQADVQMILLAAKEYQKKRDISGWLDGLIIAIRLDRELPDDARRVPSYIGTLIPDSTQSSNYIDKLAILAEITRGDKPLEAFRSSLAHIIYYNIGVWREGDSRETILKRCEQLLRLTAAMSDVKKCFGCVPEWHWRPIMKVGIAYKKMGINDEAKKYIEQAIQIARSNQNPDYRLGQYRSVLVELLNVHYDREVIISLADEMEKLANALDTPMAKEVRQSLPKILRDWKIKP